MNSYGLNKIAFLTCSLCVYDEDTNVIVVFPHSACFFSLLLILVGLLLCNANNSGEITSLKTFTKQI